jgi:hypothetical protein
MEEATENYHALKDRIQWECRILRRAWLDTRSWIKGLGLWWDLALLALPPVGIWFVRGAGTQMSDVVWSVVTGWASVFALLSLRAVWNYIWTPFRLDREQRRQLKSLRADSDRQTQLGATLKDGSKVFLKLSVLETDEYQISLSKPPGGQTGSIVYPKRLEWDDGESGFRRIAENTGANVMLGEVSFTPPSDMRLPTFQISPAIDGAGTLSYALAPQENGSGSAEHGISVPLTIKVQAAEGGTESYVVTFHAGWLSENEHIEAHLDIEVTPGSDLFEFTHRQSWRRGTFEGPPPKSPTHILQNPTR